jgi:hypothetical protein
LTWGNCWARALSVLSEGDNRRLARCPTDRGRENGEEQIRSAADPISSVRTESEFHDQARSFHSRLEATDLEWIFGDTFINDTGCRNRNKNSLLPNFTAVILQTIFFHAG